MVVSVGSDILEIERIAHAIEKWPRFCARVFTEREREYCGSRVNPAASFAARFAAKEAAAKALGTGFRGFRWQDAEIVNNPQGQPEVVFWGRAADLAREKGLSQWAVSLSHSQTHAMAVVVATGE